MVQSQWVGNYSHLFISIDSAFRCSDNRILIKCQHVQFSWPLHYITHCTFNFAYLTKNYTRCNSIIVALLNHYVISHMWSVYHIGPNTYCHNIDIINVFFFFINCLPSHHNSIEQYDAMRILCNAMYIFWFVCLFVKNVLFIC